MSGKGMRLSIQRLRWVLLGGALLLIAVLAVYIGYGHYRAMSAYRRILARSGVSISRDSNGVTYSQSLGGKKIFTLRAAKETSLGEGKWRLHDANLLLYTRDLDHPDQIYGKDFEYDENQGIARALGEVFMDLQPPQPLGANGSAPQGHAAAPHPEADTAKPPRPVIHIRTSGLVYLRKAGIASTDQQVEFQYGGMHCTSIGAEFNTGQNILHLQSHVTMDGLTRGRPLHVTATRADLDRTSSIANLTQPVVSSEERRARSDQATLKLRQDGSIEQAHGEGNVVLSAGTQQVSSTRLDASLSPQSIPQTARLSGGVVLIDTSVQRPMRGAARQVDAVFDAQGAPARVVATGAASASLVDHNNPAAGAHGLRRAIEGDRIVALFVPDASKPESHKPGSPKPGGQKPSSRLNHLQSTGAARLEGESVASPGRGSSAGKAQAVAVSPAPAPVTPVGAGAPPQPAAASSPVKTVQVAADDLQIQFVAGPGNQAQPSRLTGSGHTLLQQDAPGGEQEITHGDSLDAVFGTSAPSAAGRTPQLTIASAVQTGHVTLYRHTTTSAPAAGSAAGVGPAASGQPGDNAVSTGSAQRAVYDGGNGKLTLSGETELASGNVTLRAPTVLLDQATGDMDARGGVQTTMASASPPAQVPGPAGSAHSAAADQQPAVTHVLSATATFHHTTRLSEFRGSDADPVRMWQNASQLQAAVLLLDGMQHTLSARPQSPGAMVHAVFAETPEAAQNAAAATASRPGHGSLAGSPAPAGSYVRVTSPRLDYNDLQREAIFSGGVQIDGTMGEVRGQRAAVFLTPGAVQPRSSAQSAEASGAAQPDPLNGRLDRVVVSGNVQMEQPGRQGTGDQLLYTAANGSYVLTGSPGNLPHIQDAQQGSVTGTTLVFSTAGSTIVVAGDAATPKTRQGRVRTETEVRQ